MRQPGLVPDRDDELILRIDGYAVGLAGGNRIIGIADIHGELTQLPVEGLIDLISIEHIGDYSGDSADHRQEPNQTHKQSRPQRGHCRPSGISQPTPRMLRMMSLSNLRRT